MIKLYPKNWTWFILATAEVSEKSQLCPETPTTKANYPPSQPSLPMG